jgi:hypothetical protein
MRSESRISSLAAIACRIVDDRGFKAPGQSWCSVARVLAVPRGLPRARFTSSVNATTIALIRFCDQRFVSAFPRARRAIASRPARKLVNIEAP